MILDSVDINQILWHLDMFRGFYLEDRYNKRFSYKDRVDEAHWHLDMANLIVDEAIKRNKRKKDVYVRSRVHKFPKETWNVNQKDMGKLADDVWKRIKNMPDKEFGRGCGYHSDRRWK